MDHRANIDFRIKSVADAQALCFLHARVEETRVLRAMDVAALDRQASLPGVHERAPNSCALGDVDVGVVENEHRIFAAEFQHNR